MSGVSKFIDRALGPAGKIILPVIGIAAAVFTAGASLGLLTPLLGASATGLSSSIAALGIGTDTLLGSALTGAISTAGTGALIGGATAALTGGKVLKGLGQGALIGGVGGAVGGALGNAFPETFGSAPAGSTAAGTPTATSGTGLSEAVDSQLPGVAAPSQTGILPTGIQAPTATPPPATPGVAGGSDGSWYSKLLGTPPTTAGQTPGTGIRGLLSDPITGSVVKGIGGALVSGADADAQRNLANDQRNYYTQNYSTGQKGLIPTPPNTPGQRTPAQAFNPQSTGHYEFDPVQRKIVFIPAGAQTA